MRDYLDAERRAGRWNGDAPAPVLPPAVVEATSARYLDAFRRLTGAPLAAAVGGPAHMNFAREGYVFIAIAAVLAAAALATALARRSWALWLLAFVLRAAHAVGGVFLPRSGAER